MKLENGRCCGRKPLLYKRGDGWAPRGHYFCDRCDRCYDAKTFDQLVNWAWTKDAVGEFVRKVPHYK